MTNQVLRRYIPCRYAPPDCTKPHEVRAERPDFVIRQSCSDTSLYQEFSTAAQQIRCAVFLVNPVSQELTKEEDYEFYNQRKIRLQTNARRYT
jgi:hypothetical protein